LSSLSTSLSSGSGSGIAPAKSMTRATAKTPKKPLTKAEQSAAFMDAARDLGCDDDPERFKETVQHLAKAPPAPGPSKAKR
jgi:hypothetical protein